MDRSDLIRQSFHKQMKLLELGASYNPIVAKRDGWQTTVVDHLPKAELITKYHDNPDLIEDVDVVWQDGSLADAVPTDQHGSFDGIIGSHVGEHLPDLIGFFQSADKLLKPDGIFFLALPDKRLCFDFFQPHSTTGQVIDAIGRVKHSRGAVFDHSAYFTFRGGVGAWSRYAPSQPFSLVSPLASISIDEVPGYQDAHKWHFTPASFRLLMLELWCLNLVPWVVDKLHPMDGIEFMVWLKRGVVDRATVDAQRFQLLQEMVAETQLQLDLSAAPPAVPEPAPVAAAALPTVATHTDTPPRISVVIPLYNGGRFIAQALQSVLDQTLTPHEIIVVNDGSTDDGPAIVTAMAEHHPITVLNRLNGGQSAARNEGIRHSTGDYIALLDQDDYWYPIHLAELVKPFLVPPTGAAIGWVYSDLDEIDTEGNLVCRAYLSTLGNAHPKRHIFECLRQDMFILPGASLMSRKAFDAVHGFDERLSGYEDDDLFMRMFRAGYDNIFIKQPLSQWRIYTESSSYTPSFRRSRVIYAKKLIEMFPDDPKRARYLIRDLLVPRFYPQVIDEYGNALRKGSTADIAETRKDFEYFLDYLPRGRRRLVGRVLAHIDSQRAALFVYQSRNTMRPFLRPLLHRFPA